MTKAIGIEIGGVTVSGGIIDDTPIISTANPVGSADSAAIASDTINYLIDRINSVEDKVRLSVSSDELIAQILISEEDVVITAENIGIVGDVTFADWLDTMTTGDGGIDMTNITTIKGGRIQTGSIRSLNYSESAGSQLDLDNGTLNLGGYSSPRFSVDTSGNMVCNNATINGDIIAGSSYEGDEISVTYTEADVTQDALSAGIAEILAGVGSDYRLTVDTDNALITIGHKDVVYNGVATSGSGIRPALGISSAGIAMGYNGVDDVWVNSVAINASGDATFSGSLIAADISTGSGNFTVDASGNMSCSNATINGDIVSGSSYTGDSIAVTYTDADVTATQLASGVNNITANIGSDYEVVINDDDGWMTFNHKDSNILGTATSGSGIRHAIGLTSAGIVMGYNDTDDSWVTSVTIDGSGDATFSGSLVAADISTGSGKFTVNSSGVMSCTDASVTGTLTAGSLISGSVTTDGVAMGTIRVAAGQGATHAITDHAEAAANSTKNILENSATSITMDNSELFKSSASGSRVFIGSGGIFGKNSSDVEKFSLNATTGLMTCVDASISGTLSAVTGTFSGDISTDGSVICTGKSSLGGYNAAVIGSTTESLTSGGVFISTASGAWGVDARGYTGVIATQTIDNALGHGADIYAYSSSRVGLAVATGVTRLGDVDSHLVPYTHETRTLGDTGSYWLKIYAKYYISTMTPQADNLDDLRVLDSIKPLKDKNGNDVKTKAGLQVSDPKTIDDSLTNRHEILNNIRDNRIKLINKKLKDYHRWEDKMESSTHLSDIEVADYEEELEFLKNKSDLGITEYHEATSDNSLISISPNYSISVEELNSLEGMDLNSMVAIAQGGVRQMNKELTDIVNDLTMLIDSKNSILTDLSNRIDILENK